jgi:hypothetical protein
MERDPDIPESAAEGYPNEILLLLVVQKKCSSSNTKLPARTLRSVLVLCDDLALVQSHACWIKKNYNARNFKASHNIHI